MFFFVFLFSIFFLSFFLNKSTSTRQDRARRVSSAAFFLWQRVFSSGTASSSALSFEQDRDGSFRTKLAGIVFSSLLGCIARSNSVIFKGNELLRE